MAQEPLVPNVPNLDRTYTILINETQRRIISIALGGSFPLPTTEMRNEADLLEGMIDNLPHTDEGDNLLNDFVTNL